MIKTPTTNAGSGLAAIEPIPGGIDGTPFSVTGTALISTNEVGSEAFYIFSTVAVHFRTSQAGTNATTNDTPIPANTPMVFACNPTDKISLIKMTGQADGTTWVMRAKTFDDV